MLRMIGPLPRSQLPDFRLLIKSSEWLCVRSFHVVIKGLYYGPFDK